MPTTSAVAAEPVAFNWMTPGAPSVPPMVRAGRPAGVAPLDNVISVLLTMVPAVVRRTPLATDRAPVVVLRSNRLPMELDSARVMLATCPVIVPAVRKKPLPCPTAPVVRRSSVPTPEKSLAPASVMALLPAVASMLPSLSVVAAIV